LTALCFEDFNNCYNEERIVGRVLSTLASVCLELHVTSVKQSAGFDRYQSVPLLKIE